MTRHFVFAVLTLATAVPTFAGKYNPTLSVGDPMPKVDALPGIGGKTQAIADEKAAVTVVAFTCNTCPYAVDHEDRLNSLAKSFQDKPVRLVVINANSGKSDSLDAMKSRAKEKEFAFLYLKDATGAVAKAFGATRTPEFVVLSRDHRVVYLGALDDDPNGKNVKQRYVEDAVAAALAGQEPAVAETPPIGCGIKFPRARRGE